MLEFGLFFEAHRKRLYLNSTESRCEESRLGGWEKSSMSPRSLLGQRVNYSVIQ